MKLKYWLAPPLALFFGLVLALGYLLDASRPVEDGEMTMKALSAPVAIKADNLGVPSIAAENREDALRALGFLHARDRLFQMELIRRKMAGRLAEVFGEAALALDRQQRIYGFLPAARAMIAKLPEDQLRAVTAYAEGVNRGMASLAVLPPEFLALGIRPDPWQPEDSMLVALSMFQTLSSQEQDERMLTVMEQALPPELVAFLTPDTDQYTTVIFGGSESRRPATDIPRAAWSALDRSAPTYAQVDALGPIAGSNNWAVGGQRTRDGRALVANDMHLDLGVPNIWYRTEMHFGDTRLAGLTLPGLPLLVAGSNGHVAWGFTNVDADTLDLIPLELDPENPNRYRTPTGWQDFEVRGETIAVKNARPVTISVRSTVWGPLSPAPLLGKPVAVHWTALQPDAIDFGMLDLFKTETLEATMAVMNRSGGPNQNVALADDRGHIGWTLLGRFPLRQGFDGSVTRPWADGHAHWAGYIPPTDMPHLIDPPQGYLATANNRAIGSEYPHSIAHNQANGYRAYRISQQLAQLPPADEKDMLAVQMDTTSEVFEFYRQLVLGLAGADSEAGRYVAAWNGRMDGDSVGMPLLWTFRDRLAGALFTPVVARCKTVDPAFRFGWRNLETPMRKLLEARLPETLPDTRYPSWNAFLQSVLERSVNDLKAEFPDRSLGQIAWGAYNRTPIQHPFSRKLPWLSGLLDMPAVDNGGCAGFCVRIIGDRHGATERMVVSPNHPEDGILHMPGGQSGHPLSEHYRDQQQAWNDGRPLPFLSGPAVHELRLVPVRGPSP